MSWRLVLLSGLLLLLLSTGGNAAAPPLFRTDLYGDPLPTGAIARMGSVRWRAPEGIWQMAFVPDGKHLATSWGSSLSLWDLRTGKVARTINDDITPLANGFARAFAFTPDGKHLLSADVLGGKIPFFADLKGRKPTLLLWDFPSGKLLSQSPDLGGEPFRLAIRRDGRLATCATGYGDVLLWEPGSKTLRRVLLGHERKEIRGLAFTADGKRLVVLRGEDTTELLHIDVASGKVVKQVDLGLCGRFAIASDGGIVATYTYPDQLFLYDPTTGKKQRLALKESVNYLDLSFSSDSRTLLAKDGHAHVVLFWDVAKGQLLRRLHVPDRWSEFEQAELLLSHDGKTLASVEKRAVVRLWDAHTGRPVLRHPGPTVSPCELAFSTDGKELVAFSYQWSFRGEVYRWEIKTGKLLSRIVPEGLDDGDPIHGDNEWRLSPCGRHLAARRKAEIVNLYDTQTGKRLVLDSKGASSTACAFTPDGRALAVVGSDRSVRFWDTTTGKTQRRLELSKKDEPISWLCFTPDGRGLVGGERWRKVHLWDVVSGRPQTTLGLPMKREPFQKAWEPWETTFSPDGRYLFLSSTTNLWIWDLQNRQEIGPFEEDKHDWRLVASGHVTVSPDSRLLAWVDPSWTLCLYEIATGKIVHRFPEAYSSITFAPTGWRLATACDSDASVLIWDLPSLFRAQPLAHPPPTPETLWADLAAIDAVRAHRLLWRLASLPKADTFLTARLTAVEPVPAERLRSLISDLGHADFTTRQKAEQALIKAREAARDALAKAHRNANDVELRFRLERLLARLQPRAPDRIREARAVWVLEARNTSAARRLLQHLASGLPEARLTREAKAALRRLTSRSGAKP